jgi:hypothetical protein
MGMKAVVARVHLTERVGPIPNTVVRGVALGNPRTVSVIEIYRQLTRLPCNWRSDYFLFADHPPSEHPC